MKRLYAVVIVLALLLAMPIASSRAAEAGELLIASEKVTGEVGDVVTVDFYLYPNLPEGKKLDTIQGSMKFDPEFLTLGAINLRDDAHNLQSLMLGKAYTWMDNLEDRDAIRSGIYRFSFIDAYGVESDGFWFQAEFRIEKEGATDFIFNGIQYSGVDSEYKAVSYAIDPVSVGGVYTEGNDVPNDPVEETFAPLSPVVETPVPVTPTPRPSNGGQTVPAVSVLPTVSVKPSSAGTGLVTPEPPQTPMQPEITLSPHSPEASSEGGDPENQQVAELPGNSENPAAVEDPNAPAGENTVPGQSDATDPNAPAAQQDPNAPADPSQQGGKSSGGEDQKSGNWLIYVVIAGIALVVALGAFAIVMILKRRNARN